MVFALAGDSTMSRFFAIVQFVVHPETPVPAPVTRYFGGRKQGTLPRLAPIFKRGSVLATGAGCRAAGAARQ